REALSVFTDVRAAGDRLRGAIELALLRVAERVDARIGCSRAACREYEEEIPHVTSYEAACREVPSPRNACGLAPSTSPNSRRSSVRRRSRARSRDRSVFADRRDARRASRGPRRRFLPPREP